MTPCSPRTWSRRQLARGLTPPLAGTVAALWLSVDLSSVMGLLVAYGLLDWLAFAIWRPLRRSEFSVSSALHVEGDAVQLATGGTLRWELTLSSTRSAADVLVTPIIPLAAECLSEHAVTLPLERDEPVDLTFHYRALQPGRVVFTGILVRRASPLRLFQRTLLLGAPRSAPVVPESRTTADPRLLRFLRAGGGTDGAGRVVHTGMGSDFSELRPYRFPDPLNRVDWKASARTTGLIVREYESPRDFHIRVLFDASPDMTWNTVQTSGFAHAADLVARLGWVAAQAKIPLRMQAYDRRVELDVLVRQGARGQQRLLAELVDLPHRVLLSNVLERASPDAIGQVAAEVHRRTLRRWRGFDAAETVEAFVGRQAGGRAVGSEEIAAFLADVAPLRLIPLQDRCPECAGRVFPDEFECARCGWNTGGGELPVRAATLTALLAETIRHAKGRELLLLVSTLQGGEACEDVARLLELAASGHRTVHVAVPTLTLLADWRPTHPASLPPGSLDTAILADVERLGEVNRIEAFCERLVAAGVHVHRLEDRESLDDIVAGLLLSEILAP